VARYSTRLDREHAIEIRVDGPSPPAVAVGRSNRQPQASSVFRFSVSLASVSDCYKSRNAPRSAPWPAGAGRGAERVPVLPGLSVPFGAAERHFVHGIIGPLAEPDRGPKPNDRAPASSHWDGLLYWQTATARRLVPQIAIRSTSSSVISSCRRSYSPVVRADSCPAMYWAFSSVPPFFR
jgi:hypothetical protein